MIGNLKVSQCATDSMGAIAVLLTPRTSSGRAWSRSAARTSKMRCRWAAQLDTAANRVEAAQPELYRLAAGGTAAAIGLNAPTTSTTRSPLRSPA